MIPDIQSLTQRWNYNTPQYTSFDAGPQTFYFTLIHLLKLQKSKSILEIACGGGLLLPYVVEKKQQSSLYLATDLSEQMVKTAQKRLHQSFNKYESKLTFQQWKNKNNVIIKQADGQKKIEGYGKFDTIICNLVLMLTSDPQAMLKSLNQIAEDNGLLGLTIWGSKVQNNLLTILGRVLKQFGIQQNQRSPFYLNEKIDELVDLTGWQIVLKWEQVAAFPFLRSQDLLPHINMISPSLKKFDEQLQKKIKQRVYSYYNEQFKNKRPMLMSNTMMIIRKIKKII